MELSGHLKERWEKIKENCISRNICDSDGDLTPEGQKYLAEKFGGNVGWGELWEEDSIWLPCYDDDEDGDRVTDRPLTEQEIYSDTGHWTYVYNEDICDIFLDNFCTALEISDTSSVFLNDDDFSVL